VTTVPATPLHRAPAGLKLALLAGGLLLLAVARSPVAVAVALAVVVTGAACGRLRPGALARQVRPVLPILLAVALVQVWLTGPRAAVVGTGSVLVGVAAAGLVTLTTRTTALLEALVALLRPLRRLGVDADRVALVLALAVRSVPVLAELAGQVRQARSARGADRSMRALAVPLVIRTVRHADRLGEALAARGVDD
jgi:biotin transport system permease protein